MGSLTMFALMISLESATPEKVMFEQELFEKYQSEGTPVLIDVWASWCPTCKIQQEVLGEYFNNHPDSKIKVLVIDYDEQQEWVRYFKAPRQSTLYLYQNNEQVWFSVAETRAEQIIPELMKVDQI